MAKRALSVALSVTVVAAQECACIDRLSTAGVPLVTRTGANGVTTKHYAAGMQNYTLHASDFGASCKKHLEPAQAACTNLATGEELPDGERASWCDEPWCYVDPCTCNLADVAGGPTVKTWLNERGVNPVMAYSYNNCKSAGIDSSMFGQSNDFDTVKYCDPPCQCQSLPTTVPRAMAPDGSQHTIAAKKDFRPYPGDFGASCKTHLETGDSRCFNLVTGEELPEGERAAWCRDPWCFVDPCTCNLADVGGGPSGAFMNEDGSETIVGYSYGNCKASSSPDYAVFGQSEFDKKLYCDKEVTCSAVKDVYKKNECCGKPDKSIMTPVF